jgi:hypothetical protein
VATAPAVVAAAAPAAGAVAAPAVVAAAAPAAGAVAAPAVVAAAAPAAVTVSSSLSTAALATAGIAVASTTLTSDSPKSDEKKSCPYPTGLTLSDPIPIAWHKIPQLYPSPIQLDGIDYFRDNPTILPRGGRIGVPARFWPRLGKIVQLVSERRGKAASNFRAVLESYGFNWENRRFLQADHAQDLQWASPKNGENLDTFSNLWPYDGAANMSAGPTQNQFQRVSFCESRNGPPMVNVPIQSIKRPGGWGRYFVIRSVGMP